MKITKEALKQLIREEINEIALPEPELDPESPFARFYEIMVGSDRHPSEDALISRVERCLQDPEGAGKCADIANAASDALYELRRSMSSENHDRFRPLWAALAYLSDIPQNPEVHAGWKLNPKTIEDLKSGFEIFKQEKPHRSFALEEKKITKNTLKRMIREELNGYATLGPGMDLEKRRCKGTKQWYDGSCRYPADIEKLKAAESESTHVKTPYEKELERAGSERLTMAAPGPFKDLPSAEAGGWDDPPVGKPGYKGKPRLEGPHAQSVKQYHALANAALRGSRNALRILKKYAAASPDAKAILDAVYEENAGLQLSRLGTSAAELEVAQLEENAGKGKTKMKLTKKQLTQIILEELEAVLAEDASDEMRKKTVAAVWEEWCLGSVKKWPTDAYTEKNLSIDTLPSSWKNNADKMKCATRAKKLWAKMKKE